MLPINPAWKEGSVMDRIETTPKMDLAMQDIAPLVEEWRASHAISSPLLQRRAQREAAPSSLQGLRATLPRKSIAPLGLAVDGVAPQAVRAMQSFRRAGQWHDARLLHQPWQAVATALGAAEGGLRVEGRAVPQPGVHAGGVKRPDGGALGQRAHCQAGGGVGAVRAQGSTMLDRRWSMPPAWLTDDAEAARRRPCGLPAATTCKPKPALAQERRAAVVQRQGLRWRGVVADEACGGTPGLLEGVAGRGLGYCAAVPHATRVWAARPATPVPPGRGRGRRPPRERLVEGAPEARTVRGVAPALPAAVWPRQTSKAGSQGPMVAEGAALRVVAVRDTLPGPAVWVGRRRHLEPGELKTSLCHAPVDTALEKLGHMSGRRWPIATCCEDRKHLLGMGDDAVRSWTGWHHHRTLSMLAHFFVVRMRLR